MNKYARLQLKNYNLIILSKKAKQQRSRNKSLLTLPAMISRFTEAMIFTIFKSAAGNI